MAINFTKTHSDLESKQIARDIISGAIDSPPQVVLTLPSIGFIFENMIRKFNKDCQFICAEKDKHTYEVMIDNTPPGSFSIHNCDVFHLANSIKQKVDIAWFDLCGSLTMEIQQGFLQYIVGSCFRKGCIASITIMYSRQPSDKALKVYSGYTRYEYFRYYFPELVIKFGASVGRKVQLVNYLEYSDIVPMHVITFKHI